MNIDYFVFFGYNVGAIGDPDAPVGIPTFIVGAAKII